MRDEVVLIARFRAAAGRGDELEALAAHRGSERTKAFGRTVATLLDGAPELMFSTPLASA